MVQEAIVGIVVLGAAGFVVRRVITAIRPPAGRGACPSCESGTSACADSSASTDQPLPPGVKPLLLIRPKGR